MLDCTPDIAAHYGVPVALVAQITDGQRGSPVIASDWLPALSRAGFEIDLIHRMPCVTIAAASWVLASQRALVRVPGYVESLADSASAATGVPSALLLAVAWQESHFDPLAVSQAGAQGLMQFMPDTWAEFGEGSPFSPQASMQAGARYLAYLLKRYNGDVRLALAAYNAGPTAVDRAGGKVPSFKETQKYVPGVLGHWARFQSKRAKA